MCFPVGITVTLKTAWSEEPFVKKVGLVCEREEVMFTSVESISDPRPAQVKLKIGWYNMTGNKATVTSFYL